MLLTTIAVMAAVAVFMYKGGRVSFSPTKSRTNPESLSPDKLIMSATNFHSPTGKILFDEARLSSDGFVVVYAETVQNGQRGRELGRSSKLTSGTHSNVEVDLNRTADMEVLYAVIEDSTGQQILDENSNSIELQIIIGDLTHGSEGYH